MFAVGKGQRADDGGRSSYTAALLKHLFTPGSPLHDAHAAAAKESDSKPDFRASGSAGSFEIFKLPPNTEIESRPAKRQKPSNV